MEILKSYPKAETAVAIREALIHFGFMTEETEPITEADIGYDGKVRATHYKKEHATYNEIKAYILEEYGYKVHTTSIAEVKREYGVGMINVKSKEGVRHPKTIKEKHDAIVDALYHFRIIDKIERPYGLFYVIMKCKLYTESEKMNIEEKKSILLDGLQKFVSVNNKFNYMSLKKATTLNEYESGKDKFGNQLFVKNNLDKGIIYLSEPSTFNDPHEFEFNFDLYEWRDFFIDDDIDMQLFLNEYSHTNNFDLAIRKCSKYTQDKSSYCKKEFGIFTSKIANQFKDYYGIFCLAPSPYDDYYWTKYCNNYNGICCEYDNTVFKQDEKLVVTKVAYKDDKVIFIPEYADINSSNVKSYDNLPEKLKKRLGKKINDRNDIYIKVCTTKTTSWASECENRVIAQIADRTNVLRSREYQIKPVKIYIGCKVTNDIKNKIIDFCNNSSPKIQFEIVKKENCVNFYREFHLIIDKKGNN